MDEITSDLALIHSVLPNKVPHLKDVAESSDPHRFVYRLSLNSYQDKLGWYVFNWKNFIKRLKFGSNISHLHALGLRAQADSDPVNTAIEHFKPLFESVIVPPGSSIWPDDLEMSSMATLLEAAGLREADRRLVTVVRSGELFSTKWWSRQRDEIGSKLPTAEGANVLIEDFLNLPPALLNEIRSPQVRLLHYALKSCVHDIGAGMSEPNDIAFEEYGVALSGNAVILHYPRTLRSLGSRNIFINKRDVDKIRDCPLKTSVGNYTLNLDAGSEKAAQVIKNYGELLGIYMQEGSLDETLDPNLTIRFVLTGNNNLYRLTGRLTHTTYRQLREQSQGSIVTKRRVDKPVKKEIVSLTTSAVSVDDGESKHHFVMEIIKRGKGSYYFALPELVTEYYPEVLDENIYKRVSIKKMDENVWKKYAPTGRGPKSTHIVVNREKLPKGVIPFKIINGKWFFHIKTITQVAIPVLEWHMSYRPLQSPETARELRHELKRHKALYDWILDPHKGQVWGHDLSFTIEDPECPVQLGNSPPEDRAEYLYEKGRRQGREALAFRDERGSDINQRHRTISLSGYDKFIIWFVVNYEIPFLTTRCGMTIKLSNMMVCRYIAKRYAHWLKPETIYFNNLPEIKYETAGRTASLAKNTNPDLAVDKQDPLDYLLERAHEMWGAPTM